MLRWLQLFQSCPVWLRLPAKALLPQKEMGWGADAVAGAVLMDAGVRGGGSPRGPGSPAGWAGSQWTEAGEVAPTVSALLIHGV